MFQEIIIAFGLLLYIMFGCILIVSIVTLQPPSESVRWIAYCIWRARCWWSKRRVAWHKKQLEKLDRAYSLHEAEKKLVIARNKHYANGGSPDSPDVPELEDFFPTTRAHLPYFHKLMDTVKSKAPKE